MRLTHYFFMKKLKPYYYKINIFIFINFLFMFKRTFLVLFFYVVFVYVEAQQISGFSNETGSIQKQLEQKFDAQLSASNIGETIKLLSSEPHHVGSVGGKKVADIVLNRFKSWGWDAQLTAYEVLFPSPKTRIVEIVGGFKAALKEPPLKEDATSNQTDQLPTYNCWSADGNVTAELVFVNYGIPEDYEVLEKYGIDVRGKIVIVKYGRSWRGIKPKVAQEKGAIGCIIYSDPKDDGYTLGDVYPKGAYKNEYGVQRGSVMDMPIYPGDPLTPFIASTKDAKRIDRKDAPNLLKIPVIPISYGDAQPLLESLEGAVAPLEWAGALPITYHLGPSKKLIHLQLEFNWQTKTAYNVIAKIPGSTYPDQWVIRGNHHDAWVNGANDPISGLAALMEEAKAIGTLVKTGWKPKRTLIYCAWDAEEPGLIGSTEWVEEHKLELQEKAVVYINSDGNGRGFLHAAGSHALENTVSEVSKDIKDPQTGGTVFERSIARSSALASNTKTKKEIFSQKTLRIGALGSGSDYSPFIQHACIPSIDLGYGGENSGGEYHSIYDSYDHYARFKDPKFEYGLALSQTAGHIALRIAQADHLPFDFKSLHRTVKEYLAELVSLCDQTRENTLIENELIAAKVYELAADPTKKLQYPTPKTEVPYLDFSPLQNALHNLYVVANKFSERKASFSPQKIEEINAKIYKSEQQLLLENGLPRRSWYRHSLYAPGFYTGYGVKTLPGIREALEQRNWKEAQEQIAAATQSIRKLSDFLENLSQ